MKKPSITELRKTAQNMGIKWDFSDTKEILARKIDLRGAVDNVGIEPPVIIDLPSVEVLVSAPIGGELEDMLAPYKSRGLRFAIVDDGKNWTMETARRSDTGSMSQPLKAILACAEAVMK